MVNIFALNLNEGVPGVNPSAKKNVQRDDD